MTAPIFPITALYGGLFALMLIALSVRVVFGRAKAHANLDDGGDPGLLVKIRSFGNYTEYVPLALIAMLLAESSGAPGWLLHAAGLILLAGRLLHAFGLSAVKAPTFGRIAGMLATWVAVLLGGGASLYLAVAAV